MKIKLKTTGRIVEAEPYTEDGIPCFQFTQVFVFPASMVEVLPEQKPQEDDDGQD